jgi:hypothetical protein
MSSAAFSPISTLGAWVCPRMIDGITDASATRSPRSSGAARATHNCGTVQHENHHGDVFLGLEASVWKRAES